MADIHFEMSDPFTDEFGHTWRRLTGKRVYRGIPYTAAGLIEVSPSFDQFVPVVRQAISRAFDHLDEES